MRFQSVGNLLAVALAAAVLPAATEAKTCLMLYQMADNNLEYYLRQDYQELTNSQVIKSADLRTWVYYDALNQGGSPLPNTVDQNGNALTATFTGSRYLTWDPSIDKMRVNKELQGEQNSDTQASVTDFMEHALDDCLANGFDSLFAVFSSHGGGFAGYGGDENARKLLHVKMDEEKYRKLLQTNAGIASAVRAALDNKGVAGNLEVIGFDACLMQAVGAADDYKFVADYLLASEAVEPGHGWAYEYLQTATSALELAQEILDSFLTQTQGGSAHQSPKTMAILDTRKFVVFIDALEAFSETLLELIPNDISLHTFVSRSRSAAVAFEGIVDAVGSQNPSGVDIGSWLEEFQDLCNPGGTLGTELAAVIAAYNDMFVAEGVGPGTSPGTGMHITWPSQNEYKANKALWNQVLFNNANYVTQITPNFTEFLRWFLPYEGTAPDDGSDSVCVEGAQVSDDVGGGSNADKLIKQDSGAPNAQTGTFDVAATISPDVSQMLVEYGIDLTTPLGPVLTDKGYEPQDDEYLYLLGGDVAGKYTGNRFTASWDQNFYFLNITGTNTFEALYVFDQGDGSKKIPAMYFPEDNREDVAELQFLDYLFFDFDYWIDERGARFGFLKFSVDEAEGRVNDNLSLFISNDAGVFSEQPRSARGLMIPLVYIDAYIQGRKLNTLPGGFNQTVISWSEELDYNILTTPADQIFKVIPSTDAVIINMYAYNHGDSESEPDVRYYDVRRERGAEAGSFVLQPDNSGAPEELESSEPSSSTCLTTGLALLTGLGVIFGLF